MNSKIEQGVPIPKANHGSGKRGAMQALLCEMKKGDSRFFPGLDTRALCQAGITAFGRGNFTTRKVDGGARIWRL